jgi:glycosyltransferase involved in cell wall biosynthesis
MRIIIINDHGFINGGAAQVAIQSAVGLSEAGYDVTYLSGVGLINSETGLGSITHINFSFDELIENPSKINAGISGIWNYSASTKLHKVLDRYSAKDTIVHIHTWNKSFSSSIFSTLYKHNFKIIISLHDYFLICPNGGLFNYVKNTHCIINPMSTDCLLSNCDSRSYMHKLWRYSRHLVQQKIANVPYSIKNYIFVSNYSKKLIEPFLDRNVNKFVVTNPINVNFADPVNVKIMTNFTFVGRLSPEKGAKIFAEATRGTGIPSVFVGEGSDRHAINLLNPLATLTGWVDMKTVSKYLSQSRALIFPSLLHETQGMSVLEAAAHGVPSIVSDACAASEWVEDGVTGLLFNSGDSEDLLRKILILQENPELAANLGIAAYDKFWANPPTLSNHVNDLLKCYSDTLRDSQ